MAGVPRPVVQVALDGRHDAGDDLRRHPGEAGRGLARAGVEHALGMRPERAERPVRRIARDREHLGPDLPAEPARELLARREDAVVQLGDLGQVVAHEPHLSRHLRVVGDDHHRAAGDPAQLAHAALAPLVPVVDGEDGHRGIDAVVAQRQPVRARPDGRRELRGALRRHHIAGLDGDHVAVARLVGAGARADVDHRAGVTQRRLDARAQLRILLAGAGVAAADGVVAGAAHQG